MMVFFNKKRKQRIKEDKNFRLHNEILKRSHELEKKFNKLEEIKRKAKSEKNENLRRLIVNEYIHLENEIKIMTIQLKDLQKTYIANLDFLSKEELLETYKQIDKYKIANNDDLINIVNKINNIQKDRIVEESERKDIEEIFSEGLDNYDKKINDERVDELLNKWSQEIEQEELEKENISDDSGVVDKSEEEKINV